MPRRYYDAVLFDNDGVLVASEPLHWAAWGDLLEEIGIPYQMEELQALVGKTAPQILSALLDQHRPGWSRTEYDLDALALRKNDFYLQGLDTKLRAYPGVREGLEWLRAQGIRTAVVSNAKRRELERALKAADLTELLEVKISRDDVPAPKPDPTPYLWAARQLGVAPERCLAVEDSPPGIASALIGGIPAGAVLTNFPRQAMEQPVQGRPELRPIWIGQTLAELFEWLKAPPPLKAPKESP